MARKPYPTDVDDHEWEFVAPYLALIREDAPQREHDLREICIALRWIVRSGALWRRMIPNDLPPWGPSTSRSSAGSRPASSRTWSMTCGRS